MKENATNNDDNKGSMFKNKETISQKNDRFRRSFIGGMVVVTQAVQYSKGFEDVIRKVREFEDFNSKNDPYGEHDFGKIDLNGTSYFWKIDYYDDNYEFFKEDGKRVLTIMRADEY